MATFERRLQLRRLLEGGKREWSLRELAVRLGVAKLTIQRDLDALTLVGAGIEARRDGQQLRWFVREAPALAASPTSAEVVALAAAGQALHAFRGTDLYLGLERARGAHRPVASSVEVLVPRYPRSARKLSPAMVRSVTAAILESRRLRLEYQARGAADCKILVLEPAGFEEVAGVVYLQGRVGVGRARQWRTLVGSGIRSAVLLDERFVPAPRRVRRAFGAVDGKAETVTVRFDAAIAPFIEERVWHPSQRLTRAADGSVTWRARVSGLHEVVGWVMSWGARAELLSPPAWRAEVGRRLEGMTRRYRSGSRGGAVGSGGNEARLVPVRQLGEVPSRRGVASLLADRRRR